MAGRSVNIYLQEETYDLLRKLIGNRKISRFVDQAVVEKLTKEKEKIQKEEKKQTVEKYKSDSKNKKIQTRLGIKKNLTK